MFTQQIHPIAANLWILLLNLMVDRRASHKYEITEYRRNELVKLCDLLSEPVVEQIPPLADFRRWLTELSVAGACAWPSRGENRYLVIEALLEIQQSFIDQWRKDQDRIYDQQKQLLSSETTAIMDRYQTKLIISKRSELKSTTFNMQGWRPSTTQTASLRQATTLDIQLKRAVTGAPIAAR